MKMSDSKSIRYRTEKIVPESGWTWGYVVMFGLALPFGCCWGNMNCFGLMFNDFIESVDGRTSAFSVIFGFLSIALSFSALFANSIAKMTSMRTTALLGGLLYFLGSFASVFATSVGYLIISYGVVQGVAIGLMVPMAFATLNEYFIKNRTFMMSVAQSITGIVIMFYPIVVQFFMNTYGFRGGLAMIAGINSHIVLGMLVMHPVKWHYKIVQVPYKESQPFINSNVKDNEVNLTVTSSNEEAATIDKQFVDMENKNHLEVVTEASNEGNTDEDSKSMKSEHHQSTEVDVDATPNRLSIASGVGNGPIILSEDIQPTKNGKWQKVMNFLDLTLLKDMIYLNIVLGLTFTLFADGFFFVLQPMYMFELNVSKDDAALIMSLTAAFDMGSRIFLSIFSMFVTVKARYIFLFGAVGSIISRFVFLSVFDFLGLAVVSAVMGFLKTFIHLPTPLVIAEHLPNERFASAYGLFMFLQGIFSFLFSPVIGWIRDVTKSYVICFHTLSFIMGLCAVPWIIEFIWFWLYPRKTKTSTGKLSEICKI